jgi:hypothetical protein
MGALLLAKKPRALRKRLACHILHGTGAKDGGCRLSTKFLWREPEMHHYATNPQAIHETIEGETIVIDLESGTYFSLQGSAPAIWNALAEGQSDAQIVERLQMLYTAEASDIEAAVARFLQELVSDRLIAPIENGAAQSASGVVSQEAVAAEDRAAFVTPRLERYTDMQEIILLDPVHKVDSQGWPHAAASASETA